ncbi:MAG: sporulation-control protein [Candidatus Magnetoglobus multicellularis str. Araruama]|uniref:Sporulation-control protein n=1 Tax=Candidatus Magnetoglobus multicellularis str. Araruama TaxID=890399 RepID=A0A1V1PAZ0_9BACT|nr:MAG: sporulation-control protein [Candidatus Magnetoglobus multicellularis str. Araruama]
MTVKIVGGNADQKIDGLYFSLHTNYKQSFAYEYDDGEVEEEEVENVATLAQFKVSEPFILSAGETKEIPLSFDLPWHTPLTIGNSEVWINTGLDIKRGKDASDKDFIDVKPGDLANSLFVALEDLGFEPRDVECEAIPETSNFPLPFVQEFEWVPVSGPFHGKLDELEIVCIPEDDCLDVWMEIDRKARNMGSFVQEMLGQNESHIYFTVCEEELSNLPDQLHELIDNHL